MVIGQTLKAHFFAALVAGAASTQALAADPVLSISSTPDPAVLGSSVGVDLLISGISDLYAFQFSVSFDPAILQAASSEEGVFLTAGGATFFDGGTIDNSAGTVSFTFDTLVGPVPGVTGSGALAHLTFDVAGVGSTPVSFSDVLFLDSNLAAIAVQAQPSVLSAVPEPASFAMFAAGLAALIACRRCKSN